MNRILKSYLILSFAISFVAACGIGKGSIVVPKPPKVAKVLTELERTTFDSLFFAAIHLKNKDEDLEAFNLFKEMNKLNPSEPFPYYAMSQYYMSSFNLTQNVATAKNLAETAFNLRPDNKFYRIYYADLLARNGKYLKSAAIYEELISKGDYSTENFYKLLVLYDYAKKYEDMHRTINLMDAHTSMDNVYLETLRLEVYRLQKNKVAIEQSLNKLIDLEPNNKNFKILLVEYYDENKMKAKADSIYNSISFRDGNDDDQITYFYSLIQRKDTVKLFQSIEEAYKKENENSNIYKNLQLALITASEKFPYIINPFVNKITSLTNSNKDIIPEGAEFLSGYYESLDKTDSASKYAKKALILGSKNQEIFNNAVSYFFEQKQYDSSIYYSKIALKHDDSMSMAYYSIALSSLFLNNYDSVVKYLYGALHTSRGKFNENFTSDLYGTLGDAYEKLKKYDSSAIAYDSALVYNPENATVLNNYAYYLSERNERLEDALKMSETSLTIRKDEPTFLDTYGWIFYKMGKYEEAKKYVKKAIEKSENPSAELYHHLGDIELKLNNKEAAVAYWKLASVNTEDNLEILDKIKKHDAKIPK